MLQMKICWKLKKFQICCKKTVVSCIFIIEKGIAILSEVRDMLLMFLSLLGSDEDRKKFTELYEEYHELIESVAIKILKDQHAAEDAVQNTYKQIILENQYGTAGIGESDCGLVEITAGTRLYVKSLVPIF